METSSLKTKIEKLQAEHDHAKKVRDDEKRQMRQAEDELELRIRAQEILQTIAVAVQAKAHEQISGLVTHCLRSVFGDEYSFRILFEKKRGRTEVKFVLVKGELELDPASSSGGGIVDVAAFALRLIALVLSQPRRRRVLILDEPFKFVSIEYRERVAKLLEELAEEMDVQFLIVTHAEEFEIGTVVEIN